jgi:hypothetical protein
MKPLLIALAFLSSVQAYSQAWKWTRASRGVVSEYTGHQYEYADKNPSTIDDFGNVYAAFAFRDTLRLPDTMLIYPSGNTRQTMLVKYDANGTRLWYRIIENAQAQSLAINKEGDLFLAGTTAIQNYEIKTFIARFTNNGEQAWYKTFESSVHSVFKMRLDDNSNIYTAQCENDSMVIRKRDAAGNLVWRRLITGTPVNDGKNQPLGSKIFVNESGSVIVAGRFSWSVGIWDAAGTTIDTSLGDVPYISGNSGWAALYNTSGEFKYAIRMKNGNVNGFDAIALDNDDNAILATSARGGSPAITLNDSNIAAPQGPLVFFINAAGKLKSVYDSIPEEMGWKYVIKGIQPFSDGGFYTYGNDNSNFLALTRHDSTGKTISYTAVIPNSQLGVIDPNSDFTINSEGYIAIAGLIGFNFDFFMGPDLIKGGNRVNFFASKLYYTGSSIKGKVYVDFNNNSVADSAELGLRRFIVSEFTSKYITSTDRAGSYSLHTDKGNYQVLLKTILKYYSVSPSTIAVDFNDYGLTAINKDFRLIPEANKPDMAVYLSSYSRARPGFRSLVNLSYQNIGTVSRTGSVELKLDASLQFDSSSVAPASVSGNTLTWNYTDLGPLRGQSITLYVRTAASTPISTELFSTARVNPLTGDLDVSNNDDTLRQVVSGSYDPNDKTAIPAGDINIDRIRKNHMIDYLVRFQNTGTDTAFNVVVIDTLSSLLNMDSLQVIAASHAYEIAIKNNRIEFIFNNILLPDSNRHEPASHGFIRFRVAAQNAVQAGDTLKNRVGIYFDYNDPVITNLARTALISAVTGIFDPVLRNDVGLVVYSNSSQLNYYIKYPNVERLNMALYTIDGKLLDQWTQQYVPGQSVYGRSISFPAPGTYLLYLQGKKGTAVRKFMYNK